MDSCRRSSRAAATESCCSCQSRSRSSKKGRRPRTHPRPPASAALLERNLQPVARLKCDKTLWLDWMMCHKAQAVTLSDGGKDQGNRHHDEGCSDTDTRTGAEGQIRVAGTRFRAFRRKSVRI